MHSDLDSVEFVGAGLDSGADGSSDEQLTPPDAGGADSGDVVSSACDLQDSEACADGSTCVFVSEEARNRCVPSNELADGGEGQECESYQDCGAGLACVDWALPDTRGSVCSKPCTLGDASACDASEFCAATDLQVGDGVGFCTPSCDIFDAEEDACPQGERCVPDPFEPEVGFPSHNRCLQNDDGGRDEDNRPRKSMSSPCAGAQLHEGGCPSGLSCIPVKQNDEWNEYCVEACNTDVGDASDCSFFQSLDTCEPIADTSAIGYCK